MIRLNIIGVIFILLMLIIESIPIIFRPKRTFKHKLHKPMGIIKTIGLSGLIFFSPITLFDYGYHYDYDVILIIWIIITSILYIMIILLYIRYFYHGRKEEYLYNKFIIITPIQIIKSIIYILAAYLLLNYYCMFFAIVYAIAEIYINIKLNYE